ncbi:MAG: potassium-transporting ATPase subunit KdpC [Candidatus Omnitrophica bacterium]|nr:potassium-transporting ATPase subunit KdpC [Candidatus Omnitrophota bacterium]
MIRQHIKPAVLSFAVFTVITGVLYPILVTGIAATFFPAQRKGSLIYRNGKAVGSLLIGQPFSNPKYLWGRVSSTDPFPYNAASSSGSNYGPMNQDLKRAVEARVDVLRKADPDNRAAIPVDLVTSSASGLDPHISLAAAYYQVPRIGRTRNISEEAVRNIIRNNIQSRFLGVIGEDTVNVLNVNVDLDSYEKIE